MKGTYEVEMTYNELKRMALKEALADYVSDNRYSASAEVLRALCGMIEKTEEKEVE